MAPAREALAWAAYFGLCRNDRSSALLHRAAAPRRRCAPRPDQGRAEPLGKLVKAHHSAVLKRRITSSVMSTASSA